MKDQLEKVQEEASKVKTESETLKQQIKELQQTIQNQKKRLLEMNSEESKVKQLASDIRDLETKQKGEKVMFEALLAKSTLCPRASEPLWLKWRSNIKLFDTTDFVICAFYTFNLKG